MIRQGSHGLIRSILALASPVRALEAHWREDAPRAGVHAHSDSPADAPVALLSIGKASVDMAAWAIARLGDRLSRALVVGVPEHVGRLIPDPRVVVLPADHPIPTQRNVAAAERVERFAREIRANERCIVLLSGGGSAHLCLPDTGLTLADVQGVSRDLIRAGARIEEFNAVRKHCERLKGGRLGAMVRAPLDVYVLSDVIGDRLDVISSGPFAPDPTTFAIALAVIDRYQFRERHTRIAQHLERGIRGEIPETPKPMSATVRVGRHSVPTGSTSRGREPAGASNAADALAHVSTTIIASNAIIVRSLADQLHADGVTIADVRTQVQGDASDVARQLVRAALAAAQGVPPGARAALVWGGETTVDASRATGIGGRNQELALAAAIELDRIACNPSTSDEASAARRITVLALATDGVDGPTDAAGAFADARTCDASRAAGLDPAASLANHDSHTFFAHLDAARPELMPSLIRTGPSGTNVNDVLVALIEPATTDAAPRE
ncbi:MAG: DUF4147 domain-containing protein [Phycisphaerales bacterium]|jgi:hydroxypyruvate reductase|nr:DUF4147 domain-containing protein [Phycisphaerales bacterium]